VNNYSQRGNIGVDYQKRATCVLKSLAIDSGGLIIKRKMDEGGNLLNAGATVVSPA
jgi:hypothetical protein